MNINRRCEDNFKKSISAFKTDSSSSNSQLNEAFDAGSNCTSGTENFVSCEESSGPYQTSHMLAGRLVSEAKQGITTGVVQTFTDSTILAGQLESLKIDDTFDKVTTILNQLVSLSSPNENSESNDVAGMADSMTKFTSDDMPKSLDIASRELEKQEDTIGRYNNLIVDISTTVCQKCKDKLQTKFQTIGRDANYNVQQAVHDRCIKDGHTSKQVPLTIKNLKEHTDISTSKYLKNQIVPNKHYVLSPRCKPASSKILSKNIVPNSKKLNILKNKSYIDRLTTLLEESQNERQHEGLHKNTKFIQDESTPQWAPSFNECSIMNNESKSCACSHNPTKSTNSKMSLKTCKTMKDKEKHNNVKDSAPPSRLISTNSCTEETFLYLEHLCKVCDNSIVMENTSTCVNQNSSSSSSSALDLICDVQMASLDNEESLNTKLLRELIATKKLCRDLIDMHPQKRSDQRLRRTRQSIDNFLRVLAQGERTVSPNTKKIERSNTMSGNNVSRVVNTSPIKPVSSLRKLFSPKLSTISPSTTSSSTSVRRSVKSPIKNVRSHLKPSPKNVTQYSSKKLSSSKLRVAPNILTPPRRCLPTVLISENTYASGESNFIKCGEKCSTPKIFVTPSKNIGSNKGLKLRPKKYFADVL
ncbi:uncharacterized protein LOC107266801 isoform X2 [Cephus cinctus]|uniref:Uncharacterized protein LOC107266801 isoform X2 n=1 Tax=Cephus cinctus TaxID=211228 RepID=A0AAJ7BSE6_CEPCN|nr:uncharacterized protein LOC107266801 isoform X2 [Cephus cinctus]